MKRLFASLNVETIDAMSLGSKFVRIVIAQLSPRRGAFKAPAV